MLFSSGDLKSLLNDSEYISKVNQYDHELLVKLQEIRDQIAAYEAELKEQKAQQEKQKSEFETEKANVETIAAQKQEELVSIGANIDNVNEDIETTMAEIEASNAILAEIVEQERAAAEEAARQAAAAEAARQAAAEAAARQAEAEAASSDDSYSDDSYSDDSGEASYSEPETEAAYYEEPAPVYSSTGMIWPTSATYISSYFGYRVSPTYGASSYHEGLDIAGSTGDPIWAAAGGTVTAAGDGGGMGNYVTISHGNGVSTVYMHCSALYVSAGQYVSQGETIAAMGSTGISTGPHLHFSVVVGGTYVDPLGYISP
jgi:murein DD-endopeptidase MepM/ murein hydrolase activator NlpD